MGERFLRILYPLPYRGIIQGEARLRGLDPAQVAAMIRQESWFNHTAVSGPGARGLMQVMPATGAGLAAGAGIRRWDADLLFNPEINVALGTRFLAERLHLDVGVGLIEDVDRRNGFGHHAGRMDGHVEIELPLACHLGLSGTDIERVADF